MTHRTRATAMPAAGEGPFSASSFGPAKEDGVVRGRNPGSTSIDRKVASKIKSKTGGSRPARRLTFFNAKKVSKNACFYFCHEGLWPFSTSCPDRPPFLRDHKKASFPGSLRSHGPNGSELPRRKRLFDTGTSPLWLRRYNLAHRAVCRSLGKPFLLARRAEALLTGQTNLCPTEPTQQQCPPQA
ncbi:hypothetical protein EDC39_107129 [Geothermobacter ehrlichii]|uniref:Uncharacterized protein n=1 Tax=Geothermobacter ehrlichii TaxID=213224 RepID=A0A5D3WJF9_9BACT|nr:hypothetical protein EDC39_107129 [Geothermobacter ehrlichii]